MTTPKWQASYEQALDTIAARDLADPALKSLRTDVGTRLNGVTVAVQDVLSFALIFLHGFDEIQANGPLCQAVSSVVTNWVGQVPRGRSGGRVAGIVATNLCSVLEEFLVSLVDLHLTTKRLTAMRSADPKLHADNEKAKKQLLRRAKPSVKGSGAEWQTTVETVFSIKFEAVVAGCVLPMIESRNTFVHDPTTALQRTTTGEEIKCWALASQILAAQIARVA